VFSFLIKYCFPEYHPGNKDNSFFTRRRIILVMILFISITAIIFIVNNSSNLLHSYDEIEEINMNATLNTLHSSLIHRGNSLHDTALNNVQNMDNTPLMGLHNYSSDYEIFSINSLKTTGVTFLAVIDQAGIIRYLKWYEPETYREIPTSGSDWVIPVTSLNCIGGNPLILQSSEGDLFLISYAQLIASQNFSSSEGFLIIGESLQPFIKKELNNPAMTASSLQIQSTSDRDMQSYIFRVQGGYNSLMVINETHIACEIVYPGYETTTNLSISFIGKKVFFEIGKSFVTTYFLQSILFSFMALSFGVFIMVLLFRKYDHASILMGRQEEELSLLKERREILDKFHVILDRYLHSGPDTDQNIALICTAAGGLLNAEYVVYSRIEDGNPVIVGSWPTADPLIDDWISHLVSSYHPYKGVEENMVIPLNQSCLGSTIHITLAYPSMRALLFRSVNPCDEILGYFFMFLKSEEDINETNQIVLDLLVNALYGEESRRVSKISLHKRDVVLEAIGHSATQLLGDLSISSIIEILQIFVTQIGVHEAHLFIWNTNNEGQQQITHDYIWIDEILKKSSGQLRWDDLLSSPVSEWLSSTTSPEIRAGPPDMFPDQKEFLESKNIHSMVFIPLLSQNEYVGALFLVDRIRDRIWLSTEIEALKIASGLIMATIAKIERDEDLREREENFKLFFNQLRDFVFVLDPEGRIITANLFALQEIGVKLSDLKGMHLSGTFTTRWMEDPLIKGEIKTASGYIEKSGLLLTIEGKEIPVEIRQLPGIWNGNQAIFCICKDISALKRSEHKFATAFRSSQLLHVIMNLRTDSIIDVNTTFCEILDISRDLLICSPPEFFYRFFELEQVNKIKEVILTHGSVQDYEVSIRTLNGDIREGSLYGALIEIAGDPCVFYSIIDVTEKKQAEVKIQNLLKDLSDTNLELNNFSQIVAHDLKDPLRGIYSLATWISEDCQDRIGLDGQKYLQMILEQVHRMSGLIDGILAYSQAGFLHEEKDIVHIDSVIREVIEILSPPPSVTICIESQLPAIFGERTKILQVFQNIISNSLSHSHKDDGVIRIRAKPYGETWLFEISDNGPGIDPSLHSTIFEMFKSFSSSQNKKGTGIGLSIVKRIVESSGGSVWVHSEPGGGSTFFFTFGKDSTLTTPFKSGVSEK